jgi:hypothetical protein
VGHFKMSQVADLLIISIKFVELEIIEGYEVVGISMAHSFFSWKSEVCMIKVRGGILKVLVDIRILYVSYKRPKS